MTFPQQFLLTSAVKNVRKVSIAQENFVEEKSVARAHNLRIYGLYMERAGNPNVTSSIISRDMANYCERRKAIFSEGT